MKRPAISNLKRRGAAYWWRRTISLIGLGSAGKFPISFEFSLFTKELDLARGRSAAMTACSERLRMSLRKQVAENGLSPERAAAIFRAELRAYRDELVHLEMAWKADAAFQRVSDRDTDLSVYRSLWKGLAEEGLGTSRDWDFVDRHFDHLGGEMKQRVRDLLRAFPDLDETVRTDTRERLSQQGLAPDAFNLAYAVDLILKARAHSSEEVLANSGTTDFSATQPSEPQGGAVAHPEQVPSVNKELADTPRPATGTTAAHVTTAEPKPEGKTKASERDACDHRQKQLLAMTPTQIAEEFIKDRFSGLEHRTGKKRRKAIVGDPTLRDIRWAAQLLEKSLPSGATFASVTFEDYRNLDSWFDRIPVTIGKSPWDRKPTTTLAMIEERAIERVDKGELEADQFGLSANTSNKHWHNIKRLHDFLCEKVPLVAPISIEKYLTPEDRDEREARDKLTLEQAQAIFRLPAWTGCAGIKKRLEAGSEIIHDGLYFILPLVWYSGARREEICKLMVSDISVDGPVPYIYIRPTATGRVKNKSAKRKIPLHSELIRLGFLEYVKAMAAAGETLLFPELYPSEGTKRAIGDVFYKLWWIYIRPFVPDLKRGQAMHSARHSVSDTLKQAGIALEARNDLLGQSQKAGGEGASRYSEPLALAQMKEMVEQVEVATSHLPDFSQIRLLPAEMRVARPSRRKHET
ncbi:MAG: site-specific integrase [Parvularcula sp.]|jgi:integrase|nr:site-specific integrase [Parvularcula sp.]